MERKNFAQRLYLSEGYQIVGLGYAGADTMVKVLAAGWCRSPGSPADEAQPVTESTGWSRWLPGDPRGHAW